MKFPYYVEEEEFTPKKQKARYRKNSKSQVELTIEEKKSLSKVLATRPVDNKTVFGYISDQNNYCKWDSDNELFVMYIYDLSGLNIITYQTKTYREYNGDKVTDYFDEIPQGK